MAPRKKAEAKKHAAAQRTAKPAMTVLTPAAPLSFFEKLPPEIRNGIYEMSYTSSTPLKVKPMRVTRATRRDVAPGAASAQLCVLNRLMVSKQWFTEAVVIFASCTAFEFPRFSAALVGLSGLPDYIRLHITTIHWHSERRYPGIRGHISLREMDLFSGAVPSLKSLHISDHGYLYLDMADYVFNKHRQYRRLDRHEWIVAVRKLRGLSEFKVSTLVADVPSASHLQYILPFEEWMLAEVSKARGT